MQQCRLELPRGPDGTRRFEALGGYPTRKPAEAALADALARRSHGLALDPAKLTVDQYLDRWLTHIRTSLRARTVARYTALLRDHVRPSLGARPLKQLTPLEVQAVSDRLAVGGRKDHKPGGLAPQHILAVHRCLHRALAQAVTWRLVTHNAATHATPPPVPNIEAVTLAPEQVAVLLDAADHTPSPWLGTWTVLAAATGTRNGELCGLQWADLDLDAGTVQFRQALTIVDPAVLPDATAAGDGGAGGGGRGKELAVGPLKSAASSAILTLPTLRRPGAAPSPPPATPAAPGGGAARHRGAALGGAQPASIIAAQLRHADGGALAQRVYIHQLPQTAPRLAGLIEGVFGPAARDTPTVSAACRAEGNRRETRPPNPI